ncbi:hypothetical protein GCM10027047_15770 [Rhodococcus aerolatus]
MTAPREVTAARAEGLLEIPLHRYLGLTFLDPADPAQGVRMTVGAASVNNVDVLHGGIHVALLDVACYLAVLPHLGAAENALTHDCAAQLMRGVPRDGVVEVRGELLRRGRTLAFLRAEVTAAGRVVAAGQVTKSVVALPS